MNSGGASDEVLAFTERTAARLSGVSIRRLHEWAASGLIAPSVVRQISERNTVRLYAFTDLVDLLIVAEMGKRDVHTLRIRHLLDYLHKRGHAAPLREVEFAVDARMLYWREPGKPWAGGIEPNQVVIPKVLDLEEIRARARRAAQERYGAPGDVETKRGRVGGKPVFAGTRVRVESVQAYLKRGLPDTEILAAYPLLTPADIETARSRMTAA